LFLYLTHHMLIASYFVRAVAIIFGEQHEQFD